MGLSNSLAAMAEIRLRIQDDLAEHLTLFHMGKVCGELYWFVSV
jgi:hypothetical protein